MGRDPGEHWIDREPHLRGGGFQADPSEARAADKLDREAARENDLHRVEHSVWDEPSLRAGYDGPAPAGALTYAGWLEQRIAETEPTTTWLITLGVVLAAGPWGVLGAILSQLAGDAKVAAALGAIAVAPVTEEITKLAAALWIVEKRPYWFSSSSQILLCAAAGGLCFAFIENLMYLNVYVRDAPYSLAAWRWTVCTSLHAGCSLVAGVGLVRIWRDAVDNLQRPRLVVGMRWFAAAMVIHGLYNTCALLGEVLSWLRFD